MAVSIIIDRHIRVEYKYGSDQIEIFVDNEYVAYHSLLEDGEDEARSIDEKLRTYVDQIRRWIEVEYDHSALPHKISVPILARLSRIGIPEACRALEWIIEAVFGHNDIETRWLIINTCPDLLKPAHNDILLKDPDVRLRQALLEIAAVFTLNLTPAQIIMLTSDDAFVEDAKLHRSFPLRDLVDRLAGTVRKYSADAFPAEFVEWATKSEFISVRKLIASWPHLPQASIERLVHDDASGVLGVLVSYPKLTSEMIDRLAYHLITKGEGRRMEIASIVHPVDFKRRLLINNPFDIPIQKLAVRKDVSLEIKMKLEQYLKNTDIRRHYESPSR